MSKVCPQLPICFPQLPLFTPATASDERVPALQISAGKSVAAPLRKQARISVIQTSCSPQNTVTLCYNNTPCAIEATKCRAHPATAADGLAPISGGANVRDGLMREVYPNNTIPVLKQHGKLEAASCTRFVQLTSRCHTYGLRQLSCGGCTAA